MSRTFQSLSVMASVGIVMIGLSPTTTAGNFPPRGGKSDYPSSEPSCWSPMASTVQNNCLLGSNTGKYWYMPLISVDPGTLTIKVTALAATISSGVQCIATGASRDATTFTSSGWIGLSQFGGAADINLNTTIPSGGSAMVDCYVLPGGKLLALSW